MRAFALAAMLLVSCGRHSSDSNLNLGEVEVIDDPLVYPSVVMVILPEGAGLCTGTFISPKAVLTAAHCTKETGLYRIIAGFGVFSTYHVENLGEGIVDDPNDISLVLFDSPVAARRSSQVSLVGSAALAGEGVRLVGYGCNNLSTRRGAGIKRTGTNTIASISDYLDLLTPYSAASDAETRGIIGPGTRAGTCFGDSGGPLYRTSSQELEVVGVCHAGGRNSTTALSEFVNVNQADNIAFLHEMDTRYDLGIFDPCNASDPMFGPTCEGETANTSIGAWLALIGKVAGYLWNSLVAIFNHIIK